VNLPEKVLTLVEVFERNAEAYQSAHFKEAELRQQFVNALFKQGSRQSDRLDRASGLRWEVLQGIAEYDVP
jgi:hypothetical protein